MSRMIGEERHDLPDDLARDTPDTPRNRPGIDKQTAPAGIRKQHLRDLRREEERRNVSYERAGPKTRADRWIVRAALRRLRPHGPDQPLPFAAVAAPAAEFLFNDPLPDYIDWRTFVDANGPSQGFARWLASQVPPTSVEVIPVIALDGDIGSKAHAGSAPLIAERAWPPLLRQRVQLCNELEERMKSFPVIARKPGHQAPRSGRPRWTLAAAFVRDIYGLDTVDIAQSLDLTDHENFNPRDSGSHTGRTYVREGRAHLSLLGAWPWCLTDDGALPPRWFLEREYAEVLALWHYRQSLAALAAVFSSQRGVRAHPSLSAQWVMDAARDAYRNGYNS